MRSAAYKALQERATRTVCSQATLPLYWLADIQFFQSFPKWHGVKFVAHTYAHIHLLQHVLFGTANKAIPTSSQHWRSGGVRALGMQMEAFGAL